MITPIQISPFARRNVSGISLAKIFNTYGGINQWAAENSTIVGTTTTWLDYAGVHDVANPSATNQPSTTNPDSDFNDKASSTFLTDDYLIKNTPNYGAGQTTGSLWAVLKTGSSFATISAIFSANNTANLLEKFLIFIDTGGKLNLTVHNGTTVNTLTVNTALSINSKYIIYIESNGTTTNVYINGVLQTLTGTNVGNWFNYSNTGNTLDNVVVGGAIRSSTPLYYNGKIALIGNYALPSSVERTSMLNALNNYYNVY